MCGQWLTGTTGFDLSCVVPVLICRFGGMFDLIIFRKGSAVEFFELALGVTWYRLQFRIQECCVGCVEHMRTVGHCFICIVYARGAFLFGLRLSVLCMPY